MINIVIIVLLDVAKGGTNLYGIFVNRGSIDDSRWYLLQIYSNIPTKYEQTRVFILDLAAIMIDY